MTQRERLPRVRKVLDNIEQNDDIHMTDLPQVGFVGHSLHDLQAGAATMRGGLFSQLDPGHIEMARRLHAGKSHRRSPIPAACRHRDSCG